MEKFNNNDSKVSKQINEVNNKIKDEISNYISVSQLKEFISEYFDSEQKAKECAEKGLNNPNYKYYNMTAEEILEQWNEKAAESKAFGNFLDEYAGLRLNNKDKELGLWKLDNNFEYPVEKYTKKTDIKIDLDNEKPTIEFEDISDKKQKMWKFQSQEKVMDSLRFYKKVNQSLVQMKHLNLKRLLIYLKNFEFFLFLKMILLMN